MSFALGHCGAGKEQALPVDGWAKQRTRIGSASRSPGAWSFPEALLGPQGSLGWALEDYH